MNTVINDISSIKQTLLDDNKLLPTSLCLQLAGYRLAIRSNSARFMARMQTYFAHVLAPSCDEVQAEVIAIEADVVNAGIEFVDWKREPGKTGRKDAIHDLPAAGWYKKYAPACCFCKVVMRSSLQGPVLSMTTR